MAQTVSEAVKLLREADINASDYKRGPFGKHIFGISVQPLTKEGTVRVWEGDAEVSVYPDKNHRQAVMSVEEVKNHVPQSVKFWATQDVLGRTKAERERRTRNNVDSAAKRQFNLVVPAGSRLTVSNVTDLGDVRGWKRNDMEHRYSATVTAHTPHSLRSLLVGMDETYHFIAALPEQVQSVERAHEILRPARLVDGTLRQGEWFFVPVSKTLSDELDKHVKAGLVRFRRFETMSTHYSNQVMRYENNLYAVGYVFDDRHLHHEPLWLEGWHRVVRNREMTQTRPRVRGARAGRSMRWD